MLIQSRSSLFISLLEQCPHRHTPHVLYESPRCFLIQSHHKGTFVPFGIVHRYQVHYSLQLLKHFLIILNFSVIKVSFLFIRKNLLNFTEVCRMEGMRQGKVWFEWRQLLVGEVWRILLSRVDLFILRVPWEGLLEGVRSQQRGISCIFPNSLKMRKGDGNSRKACLFASLIPYEALSPKSQFSSVHNPNNCSQQNQRQLQSCWARDNL